MLAISVHEDGGVEITGTVRELCNLIAWLALAVRDGAASPTYVADEGVVELRIRVCP